MLVEIEQWVVASDASFMKVEVKGLWDVEVAYPEKLKSGNQTGNTVLSTTSTEYIDGQFKSRIVELPYETFKWAMQEATQHGIALDVTEHNLPKIRAAYEKRKPSPDPFQP